MDIMWIVAGVAFFIGSNGLLHFVGNLRVED